MACETNNKLTLLGCLGLSFLSSLFTLHCLALHVLFFNMPVLTHIIDGVGMNHGHRVGSYK